MAAEPKYFHDRVVLGLLSINVFVAIFICLSVLLRMESGSATSGVIVQYRSNLGVSAFKTGDAIMLIGFIAFALAMLIIHIVVSVRVYQAQRSIAVSILSLGAILLVITAIVINALLALH